MKEKDMPFVAESIARVVSNVSDEKTEKAVKAEVKEFLESFPVPGSIFDRT
jgi:glycine/serine hydroxymethyltransferase